MHELLFKQIQKLKKLKKFYIAFTFYDYSLLL